VIGSKGLVLCDKLSSERNVMQQILKGVTFIHH